MGIKFQTRPGGESHQITIHVRMLDLENGLQQEALGIVGVNLVYGAAFLSDTPEKLLESLLDGLTTDRIEIDLIDFSGAEFDHIDNRVMSLRLVQLGLTGAAMFSADGEVLQPAEVLYKKPVLIERGRFRPVTYVNLDLARSALRAFEAEWPNDVEPGETVSIMEITMSNLMNGGDVDLSDFIGRADVLAATGHTVMISNFSEYYRLASYLFRYTQRRIGLAMGSQNLTALFDESYYTKLDGGILESFGRLFKNQLKLFIYPHVGHNGELVTVDSLRVAESLRHLYAHLVGQRSIVQLSDFNREFLQIHSPDVHAKIASGDSAWESMVPAEVAHAIKSRKLFGHR